MDSLLTRMQNAAAAEYPIYYRNDFPNGIKADCRTARQFKQAMQEACVQRLLANYNALGLPAALEELEKKHGLAPEEPSTHRSTEITRSL